MPRRCGRPACQPIDVAVDAGLAVAVAEDAGRQRPLHGQAQAVLEDGDGFFLVDGDGDGLAQGALFRAVTADGVVEHVQAGVEDRRHHAGTQAHAARAHGVGELELAPGAKIHHLVEAVLAHRRAVVVALQELGPHRNALALQAVHGPVDERHRLAGVRQQAGGGIARLAVGRIGLAAEQRIALQHHAPVRIVHAQHERAGADRVPVQADVLGGQARLAVEAVGFPRQRREKRHRQPVRELRVDVGQADAQRVAVDHLHAGQIEAAQVQPRVVVRRLQRLGQLRRNRRCGPAAGRGSATARADSPGA